MNFNGQTPAEVYASEVKYHFDEKKCLTEIVDTMRDRRMALLNMCTHDHPTETLKAVEREHNEAWDRLHSSEFINRERMLVMLSPLYTEDTE